MCVWGKISSKLFTLNNCKSRFCNSVV